MKNETDVLDIGVGQFFGQAELVQQLTIDDATRVTQSDCELLVYDSASFFTLVPLNALMTDSRSQAKAMSSTKKKERRYGESAEVVQLSDAAKRR